MEKVLVTGGAGYIGSVMVPMLLQKGYEVTVVDNFMYSQTPLLDVCHHPKLNIKRGDVRDQALLTSELVRADIILPLACLTGAPICSRQPESAKAINFDAVKFLAENKSKDQMLVFPSTNSGYGVGQEGIFCDESTPLNPVSLYGKLKKDVEELVLNTGECATFRFATLFGVSPRMRLDLLVNDFTYRAVVDKAVVLFEGHFKRNYLHVRDGARAFMHTIENYSKMKGRPFNIGLSDANLSKEELCRVIQKYVPGFHFLTSEIGEDPDKRNYIVSNKRIEETGFRTEYDLDFGIKELVKGFEVIRRNQYANV